MLLPASTGSGESVLMTRTSAIGPTVVVSESRLLARRGSLVVDSMVTSLMIGVPAGTAALTVTTIVNTVFAPAASAGVSTRTPVTRMVAVQPVGAVKETKVVPSGSWSKSSTFWASLGPALVAGIV